jgi:hypothetical protein
MADGGSLMPRVVWTPLAGSQEMLMSCPCNYILLEGTRGPGKTDGQLMKFRRYVGLGYGQFWRGVIFDREYKNLDDLISKSLRYFPNFGDGARFLSSKSDLKWVWPTGEELMFRQVKALSDYWKHHGQEYPFMGFNELTKFPTPELPDMLMSCNRSSFRPEDHPQYMEDDSRPYFLPELPLIRCDTTNPFGAGHQWVKRRYIDVAPPGKVVRIKTNVFNPRTKQREDIVKTQVRLFGSYKENKYLSPEYIAELEGITHPARRKAWLWGDWDIVSGGAIGDLWDEQVHVAERFIIPKGWKVDRSFDWGQAKPFSVGWWAEANGEEAQVRMADGKIYSWAPPAGTLIRIFEWYGHEGELGSNKGLRLTDRAVAKGIKKIDDMLFEDGWISERVRPGPADNMIFDVKPTDNEFVPESIAKVHEQEGVMWERSDKSKGSRKNGLSLIRERLQASIDFEEPGIYVMRNCVATLALLPGIQTDELDPDDVDSESEDHIYDEVRYRVLKGNNGSAQSLDIKSAK